VVFSPPGGEHTQEPLKMTNWILISDFDGGPAASDRSAIVYDKENGGTWQIQDAEELNKPIFVGDRYPGNWSFPEEYWYTPHVTIDNNKNISLDFFIWNGAGEDCADAVLNMTTDYEYMNNSTGSPEGEIHSGIATQMNIHNLSAGESRELRVTTDLPIPDPEKILRFRITLTSPDAFMTRMGTLHSYHRDRLPRGTATFIVKSRDAPELVPLPTLHAS